MDVEMSSGAAVSSSSAPVGGVQQQQVQDSHKKETDLNMDLTNQLPLIS